MISASMKYHDQAGDRSSLRWDHDQAGDRSSLRWEWIGNLYKGDFLTPCCGSILGVEVRERGYARFWCRRRCSVTWRLDLTLRAEACAGKVSWRWCSEDCQLPIAHDPQLVDPCGLPGFLDFHESFKAAPAVVLEGYPSREPATAPPVPEPYRDAVSRLALCSYCGLAFWHHPGVGSDIVAACDGHRYRLVRT